MRFRRLITLALSAAAAAACGSPASDDSAAPPSDSAARPNDQTARASKDAKPANARSALANAGAVSTKDACPPGADVIRALAEHDMPRVASFVDPAGGVRFSPYPYVDTTADRVIRARDISALWTARDTARWGSYDGSGEPILLPYSAYHAKFVYDVDFAHAPRVAVDSLPMGTGNATNNIRAVYRGAAVVEYHWPGTDPSMHGMDWRSLWLVFARDGSRCSLVGIVHGAWTI
jgi:hypothetical protein